jgi:ribosomal protein L37E
LETFIILAVPYSYIGESVARCPVCGRDDFLDLGFCTACGNNFPKEERVRTGTGVGDRSGVEANKTLTYEQFRFNTISGITFTVIMAVFIFIYLYVNDTDPMLIFLIEGFPIMWLILILIQWHENKGRIKNAK